MLYPVGMIKELLKSSAAYADIAREIRMILKFFKQSWHIWKYGGMGGDYGCLPEELRRVLKLLFDKGTITSTGR